jgi:hypothetical protein
METYQYRNAGEVEKGDVDDAVEQLQEEGEALPARHCE